jgi:hypothetical protein
MSHRFVLLLFAVLIASLQLVAQNPQLHITNTSLPRGQQGNIYSEVLSAGGRYQSVHLEDLGWGHTARPCDEPQWCPGRHA